MQTDMKYSLRGKNRVCSIVKVTFCSDLFYSPTKPELAEANLQTSPQTQSGLEGHFKALFWMLASVCCFLRQCEATVIQERWRFGSEEADP